MPPGRRSKKKNKLDNLRWTDCWMVKKIIFLCTEHGDFEGGKKTIRSMESDWTRQENVGTDIEWGEKEDRVKWKGVDHYHWSCVGRRGWLSWYKMTSLPSNRAVKKELLLNWGSKLFTSHFTVFYFFFGKKRKCMYIEKKIERGRR